MMDTTWQVSEAHVRAAVDTVLGLDPSQAPTAPADLNERLTQPQPEVTGALETVTTSPQAKNLSRASPLVYVLVEAATQAFPDRMRDEVKAKAFLTSVAAVAGEARAAVAEEPGDSLTRVRQPDLVAFIDRQLLASPAVAKLPKDDRIGLYALCLGMVRALDRHLQGAEKPVQVVRPPGRNDPCTCGSGRKYKKCHGAAA